MKRVSQRISNFSKKEIDYLFKNSSAVYKSKELVILTTPCLLSFGRILLITSRKVGNAPQRNLLRRRGRAIFYEQQLFQLNQDIVIIFKAPATKLTFDQFKTILQKSVKKNIHNATHNNDLDHQPSIDQKS